ncbi:MAG TPA: hypothetical protein VGA04_08710 [Streptosporangiaceae bacterium]
MTVGSDGPTRPERLLGERIHLLVLQRLLPGLPEERYQSLRELITRALDALAQAEQAALDRLPAQPDLASREIVARIRDLLGTHALVAYTGSPDPERTRAQIRKRTVALADRRRRDLLQAGLRHHFGMHGEADAGLLKTHLGDLIPPRMEVKKAMATTTTPTTANYTVDLTGLTGFDPTVFTQDVDAAISSMGVNPADQPVLRDGIIGMLLLDGSTDSKSPTFATQVSDRLWTYVQRPLVDANGQQVTRLDNNGNAVLDGNQQPVKLRNKDAFAAVDGVIQQVRGRAGAYFQELATAARQICDNGRGAVVADPKAALLLTSAVQGALQGYGSGTVIQGSLDLPLLSGAAVSGTDAGLDPNNIRGFALWAGAYPLDPLAGVIRSVDRMVELFMNGVLPVSPEMGGAALNDYYWDRINQMTENDRAMQYSRILGVSTGLVSKDAPVNANYQPLFQRLLSSLSEYDRQQRVADLLGNQRGLSLTGEHVRKAGRDLAANCTLFGYGYTILGAKKLQHQLQTCINILKLPDVQQAWGVQSAWQVVERVSSQEFHTTPNIVKCVTMAESTKKILDLIAKNVDAWSATSDVPLFLVPGQEALGSDISEIDRIQFMRQTEYWLAVNGIKDAQVAQDSQPTDTPAISSIPSMDGTGGTGGGNGHSADLSNQIQQMLNQGQTPSPEQLRKMVGI